MEGYNFKTEINRALPAEGRLISDSAILQAFAYLGAERIRFAARTRCCGKCRYNSEVDDPGYYINGGPSCQQMGEDCADPPDTDFEAFADGLIPGSFVYAPRSDEIAWPAIVDFCPDRGSHFVIFRTGGSRCCTPYAYYLTLIPDDTGEIFGGWFTVESILPFDSLVPRHINLMINYNEQPFDSAMVRANKYWRGDLKSRLQRFSPVCQKVNMDTRRVRNLVSPRKSITGKVTSQAKKLSQGIARKFGRGFHLRADGAEIISLDSSLASTSGTSSSDGSVRELGVMFSNRLSLTPDPALREMRDEESESGLVLLADLAHGQDHVHPPLKPGTAGAGGADVPKTVNPTEHSRAATHNVFQRVTIQAVMRCGLDTILTYREK